MRVSLAQRLGFDLPENQLNRRFSFSTEAPLTRAINELTPAAIPHIQLLNRHVTLVEATIRASLNRTRVTQEDPVQPCAPTISVNYRQSVSLAFSVRGFPDPGDNCSTEVTNLDFAGATAGYTLDDLYHAAFNRGREIKKRIREVSLRLIDNFTQPEVPFNFTYSTVSAQCTLTPVCVYRVGEFWHQGIGIHSHGRDEHVPDGVRNSILEYFRVVDGKLGDNLMLRLPKYDDGNVERIILDNTTTMIQTWSRTPNPSCNRLIPIEDNPAIIRALDDLDHSAQQVEDAVTSSNLAILLLPLGLNIVPVALFADVGRRMMLVYTLMSDVLTVIPLGIKGVELLIISSRRFRSVVTRITSGAIGNVRDTGAAGGEVWAAECRVRDEVRRAGIALVVTAAVFLVIGIGAEFAAKSYTDRRRTRGKRLLFESVDSSESSSRVSDSFAFSNFGATGVEERYSMDEMPR